ncbi:MAG: tRNA pseudouridine(38-40) synthase TruA [candidate division WOR-3 bacterium]|nr:tRNA pseudouridine(38-40) synthase TruA [candidate division WOR-3 bacterium]MDW8113881.1 tRNA pseudouridine(38-40) synthase TruA [candidate division WOR-3 bacterium]
MKNLLLTIEFDGRNFFGWQEQKDRRTISGEIKKVLKEIFKKEVKLIGMGRTDRGVSALKYFCNFQAPLEKELDLEILRKRINFLLPSEIYVKEIKEVPLDFNSRYRVKRKTYCYFVVTEISPIRRDFFWEVPKEIDIKKMEEAAQLFIGKKDFSKFCYYRQKEICHVEEIKIIKKNKEIIFKITGNRFLYKMVRRIVGALIDVGTNRREIKDIKNALLGKSHLPLSTAPAKGLILYDCEIA